MTPSPVLVTGGAGFIGSALVRTLVRERGERVVTADNLTYAGNLDSLLPVAGDPRHTFEKVDVCDGPAVRRLLETYRPRAVVHLAAESHVDRSIDGPADFIRTNVIGTFTMLEETRRYLATRAEAERSSFRFLQVSTDEVFGELGETGRFDERSRYDPGSPYSATKAAADHLARAWHRTYGVPVIVTGASNNYGPYQFPDKLIPLVILCALEGSPIRIYGRGEHVRDWLHVDDHVQGLIAALNRGCVGRTYLFGGGQERRNLDLAVEICRIVDELAPDTRVGPRQGLIRLVEDRPGHDFRYGLDSARTSEALHWSPVHPFDDGLRATVEWYLANRGWWERARSGAYRGDRLGLGGTPSP